VEKRQPPDLLAAAVAEHEAAEAGVDQALRQLYDVIREVAPQMQQVDIVEVTGWTREHIRQIVNGRQPQPRRERRRSRNTHTSALAAAEPEVEA
jgi:molybdopterin-guanine dinucleotide biosynthesis protein